MARPSAPQITRSVSKEPVQNVCRIHSVDQLFHGDFLLNIYENKIQINNVHALTRQFAHYLYQQGLPAYIPERGILPEK